MPGLLEIASLNLTTVSSARVSVCIIWGWLVVRSRASEASPTLLLIALLMCMEGCTQGLKVVVVGSS